MDTVFLEKICRCCLNESEQLTNLFEPIIETDTQSISNENLTYSDAMFLCGNVRCDVDAIDENHRIVELPKNICELCKQELHSALEFRIKCETNDALLREQTIESSDPHICRGVTEFIEIEKSIDPIDKLDQVIVASNEIIFDPSTKDHMEIVDQKSINELQSIDIVIEDASLTKKHKTPEKKRKSTKKDSCRSLNQNQSDDTAIAPRFTCPLCGQQFATKQQFSSHQISHKGEKRFTCEICEKKFTTGSSLRIHRRVHTGDRPYRCDQCSLTFAQGNALRCHKRIHSGEKPYECPVCHKKFTQNTILKTHMTLHTGKTIKCPDCDKMFSRASNLILHQREHTGEKPYACSHCTNRYKQKSHLDRHIDTHMGVKHTCDICGKSYTKRWSLKVHMFTHSENKPHRCKLCTAEFVRRDRYRIHLKFVHHLSATDDQEENEAIDEQNSPDGSNPNNV